MIFQTLPLTPYFSLKLWKIYASPEARSDLEITGLQLPRNLLLLKQRSALGFPATLAVLDTGLILRTPEARQDPGTPVYTPSPGLHIQVYKFGRGLWP